MDLSKLPLFAGITRRMEWLNQRQQVLAENVSNANTPSFVPSDLAAQNFRDLLKGSGGGKLAMAGTAGRSLAGTNSVLATAAPVKRDKVVETSPTGNAVNMEDQLMKVSETQANYTLMTSLYQKHVNMLRTAIGRRG